MPALKDSHFALEKEMKFGNWIQVILKTKFTWTLIFSNVAGTAYMRKNILKIIELCCSQKAGWKSGKDITFFRLKKEDRSSGE